MVRSDEFIIHFPAVLASLRKRRLHIFSTNAILLVLVVAYYFLSDRTYVSEIIVTPAQQVDQSGLLGAVQSQFSGIASLAGVNLSGPGEFDSAEAITILMSRRFLQGWIEERELLPILFSKIWDADRAEWTVSKSDDVPTLQDGFLRLVEEVVEVTRNRSTGQVNIRVFGTSPEITAKWANSLIERLNTQLREEAIVDARRSIGYLEAELRNTSIVEVRQAMYKLMEMQVHKIMLANTNEEFVFRVLDPAIPDDDDHYIWPSFVMLGLVFVTAAGILNGIIMFLTYPGEMRKLRPQES